ncbi:MAG: hypothetical protein CMJ34_03260 [Phycisphaerae bacterium]|nr:hypothetical protein [Phycisphaerae bacterium]
MSTIHPFKAIRPNPPHAADVSCPPYDVISTTEARELAEGRPGSYLHVIRPEIDFPVDADPYGEEIYQHGLAEIQRLLSEDLLIEETEPAMYAYRLVRDGRRQLGLVCTVDAAEYRDGRIRKHEKTRPDKEDDRTRHLLASSIHAEGVFLAYREEADPEEEIRRLLLTASSSRPLIHFMADDTTHTLWRIDDTDEFESAFARIPELYIADGHHRSAAGERAATARASESSAHTGTEEYNRILATVFPAGDLEILPYNRVVTDLNGLQTDELLQRLSEVGDVSPLDSDTEPGSMAKGEVAIRLPGRWHRLRFPADSIPEDDPIACLDVALLQDRVLAPILGIGDPRTDSRIGFVGGIRGTDELERRVDAGSAAIAFSLHATSMNELLRVADAGEIMPPKSTWFEPKLRSGLFAHRFETIEECVKR